MINKEEYKKALKDFLCYEDVFNTKFLEQRQVYEEKIKNIDEVVKNNIKDYGSLLETAEKLNETEIIREIKELCNKESCIKRYESEIKKLESDNKRFINLIATDEYKKAVDSFIDENEPLNNEVFSELDQTDILSYCLELSLYKIGCKIGCIEYFIVKYDVGIDREFYCEMFEKHFNAINLSKEEQELCNYLAKLNKKKHENIVGKHLSNLNTATAKDKKEKITPMLYSSIMSMANTDLADKLVNARFELDSEINDESNKTLNSLEEIDRAILDYIVIDLYAKQGANKFTDREIVTAFTKEVGTATISSYSLNQVRESLLRLQNIRISEGLIATDKLNNNLKENFKRNNPLIWLDTISAKNSKTTIYKIVGEPFYFDYAKDTGQLIEYKRNLLTDKIEGLENNLNKSAVTTYLIRRINSLELTSEPLRDNFKKIYDVWGIKDSRKYAECRKKTKAILEKLKENYNFKYEIEGEKSRTSTKYLKLSRVGTKPINK